MPVARWSRFLGEFGAALLGCLLTALAGCATANHPENLGLPPVSIQAIEYYPFLVKGYQKTFPARHIVVLTAADGRTFKDAGSVSHTPYQDHPAIGVVLDRHGRVAQQLYGPDLGPLVRDAISQSAQEAGMKSSTSPKALTDALKARDADYVLTTTVTGLWVVRERGASHEGGPAWFSAADATFVVTVYKPPFSVPFWEGTSAADYNDPPKPTAAAQPEDETEIHDQPGEVLSVALTHAVAGIFERSDLRTLVMQDMIPLR